MPSTTEAVAASTELELAANGAVVGEGANNREPLETAPLQQQQQPVIQTSPTRRRRFGNGKGTLLEAAFVDPAYSWPPADGQGKNAIELQASLKLMKHRDGDTDDDNESVFTTDSARNRMQSPSKPNSNNKNNAKSNQNWFSCCRAPVDTVVSAEEMRAYEEQKILAKEARQNHEVAKQDHYKRKERAARRAARYTSVPEGILIYRLDTATACLELVSTPHSNTDMTAVLKECTVLQAAPAGDASRRALTITDDLGQTHTLVACEQRTATAWLEAMHLMHAKTSSSPSMGGGGALGAMFRKVRCQLHWIAFLRECLCVRHAFMNGAKI